MVVESLKNKIYMIRGRQVMLDFDLAEIYGYTTKAFNQQVARNAERFEGKEFMFRLTWEEIESLMYQNSILGIDRCSSRSQNVTLKSSRGYNIKYPPYAFTEQGVYMLMTVLKGELAIKQSRNLVMAFKAMKDYIVENKILLDRRENLNITARILNNTDQISEAKKKIEKIDVKVNEIANEMNNVVKRTEISPVFLDFSKTMEKQEFLLLDGEPISAKEAYMDIYKHAKKKVYIIDNYINIKTLHLLQVAKRNLEITFFTDNLHNYLRKSDLIDFEKERPDLKIKFIKSKGSIHDRYIILDDKKVYQSGGSSKDAGNRMTSIHEIQDEFIIASLNLKIEKMKNNPEVAL